MSSSELPFAVPKRPPKWLAGWAPFLQQRNPGQSVAAMGPAIDQCSQPDFWLPFHEAGKKRKARASKTGDEDAAAADPDAKKKRGRASRAVRRNLDTIERIGREINSPDLVQLVAEIRSDLAQE